MVIIILIIPFIIGNLLKNNILLIVMHKWVVYNGITLGYEQIPEKLLVFEHDLVGQRFEENIWKMKDEGQSLHKYGSCWWTVFWLVDCSFLLIWTNISTIFIHFMLCNHSLSGLKPLDFVRFLLLNLKFTVHSVLWNVFLTMMLSVFIRQKDVDCSLALFYLLSLLL